MCVSLPSDHQSTELMFQPAHVVTGLTVPSLVDQYRLMVEHVEDYAIFMLNSEGYVTTWNRGAEKILGYAPEEILGQHFSRFYTPEQILSQVPQQMLGLAEHNGRHEYEGLRVTRTGATFWANTVVTALRNVEGDLVGYCKVTQNLTRRKQNEERILLLQHELEKRFDATFEQAAVGIAHINASGSWLRMNQKYCEILGYSHMALMSRSFWDITHPEDMEADLLSIRSFFHHEVKTITREKRYIHKDGSVIWVCLNVSAVWREDGTLDYFIVVISDITERKHAAEELALAKEAAERANRKKSQFLANMSHELRTPLNAVMGYSQMLENAMAREMDDKKKKYLHYIHISAQHLLELVNDILDLARVDSGKLELAKAPVPLASFIQDLQQVMAPYAEGKSIRIDVSLAPEITRLTADPVRLRQILLNLINNAVKFNHPGGSVSLRVYAESEEPDSDTTPASWVCFEVADTGIGIPEDYYEKVFNEFYQVDNSYARRHEGTGLGLALTKRLVEQHGGSIFLHSVLNQGSTFTVKLPA
jgi:two-component system, sensor histidine kinase and response regulator